jgi:hypothetical protein
MEEWVVWVAWGCMETGVPLHEVKSTTGNGYLQGEFGMDSDAAHCETSSQLVMIIQSCAPRTRDPSQFRPPIELYMSPVDLTHHNTIDLRMLPGCWVSLGHSISSPG